MTHSLIAPIRTDQGYQSGCVCGYRTELHKGIVHAEHRANTHIRLKTKPLPRPYGERPAIDIATAAASFLDRLYWGVDESVPATRGGWPR